jgi:hypothetical protein
VGGWVGGWVGGKKVSLRTTSQLCWDVVKKATETPNAGHPIYHKFHFPDPFPISLSNCYKVCNPQDMVEFCPFKPIANQDY